MGRRCGSRGCTGRCGRAAALWWSAGAAIVLQFVVGCSRTPEPDALAPQRDPNLPILRPHWDQVCGERRTPLVLDAPEVVDTTAIADELAHLASASSFEEADPFVDVAVSYDRSGAIRRTYVQQQTVSREHAQAVLERLAGRLRPQGRLLEPVDVRLRVNLASEAQLELLPPIECMPHVSHEPGQRPRFSGGARVVPGRICGPWRDPERCIAARLHISPTGEVEEIEPLDGNASLVEVVRESVAETKFDPALINREPVPGTLELVFRFPEADG